MSTLSNDHPPCIYWHLVSNFFVETCKIIFLSTKIHKPYVCGPQDPYISQLNNFNDPITLIPQPN